MTALAPDPELFNFVKVGDRDVIRPPTEEAPKKLSRYRETSREALDGFQPAKRSVNARILEAVAVTGPRCSYELQRDLSLKHQTCSAQISHMTDDGWLADSGEVVEFEGKNHIRWAITQTGRVQLARYDEKGRR